ncbi:MAG: hypothetical protein A2Y76_14875 [Planctomycetes bacterium RBG_13_60_9]|nr:MAG: hypothetical protein A2Y76_14875 [Planctomycetes bacterium RBG_13_60_9]
MSRAAPANGWLQKLLASRAAAGNEAEDIAGSPKPRLAAAMQSYSVTAYPVNGSFAGHERW